MLLLLGLLLAVAAMPVSDNRGENSTSGSSFQTAEKLQMEEKLENLLGKISAYIVPGAIVLIGALLGYYGGMSLIAG